MAKKAKEENSKKIRNKSNSKNLNNTIKQKEMTQKDKFDFNEEIVIGLKRIDNREEKKVNKKREEKLANTYKQKKKQTRNINNKNYKNKENELIIKDIYGKQNNSNQQNNKIEKEIKKNQKKNKIENKKVNNSKKQKKKEKTEKILTPKQELAIKKRKAIFRLVRWTSLFVIICAGIVYTLLSPIFNIENINIYGNLKISNDEIISLSGIIVNQNTFKFKKSEIENNIKKNAYVNSVEIKRKLPDAIEIFIEERKTTYMLQIGNAYAYINNQGYILEISDKKEEVPIIVGNKTMQEEIQVGARICESDLKKLSDVIKIMESATSNEISNLITMINIEDSTNYILTLESVKKIVYLGDISNLSTKMLWIIKFNEEEKQTSGEIFLNMNLNNENNKPYFRKKV